jgi:hypothetical protein
MTTDAPAAAQPGFFARLFAPPQRLAALLPDGRFFLRLVPVEPEADAASVAEQAALALETLAPFPLAQLYHGLYWQPGSPRALVYAVYRKRFPADETAAWHDSQLVTPAFVSLLVEPPEPRTTRVLTSSDAVTVFHWGDDVLVPTHALIHPFPSGTGEPERAAAREQLLRSLGAEGTVEDWDYPELRRVSDGGDVILASGARELHMPAGLAATFDVRDREEIAERRSVQRRDILLWRIALGMACLVLLCGVAEGALLFGRTKVEQLKTEIARDKQKQTALESIVKNTQDAETALSRRLYPLEMLTLAVSGGRLPPTVQINTVTASIVPQTFRPMLQITATATTNVDDIPSAQAAQNYQRALASLPATVSFSALNTGGAGSAGPRNPGTGATQPQTNPPYSFRLTVVFNEPIPPETPPTAVAASTNVEP